MRKELFVDIETNDSLDPQTGIITQLSAIYRVGGKVIETIDLKGDGIYARFNAFVDSKVDRYNKDDKMYFIAYNAGFDTDFIRAMFMSYGNKFFGSYFFVPSICVMQMAASRFMRANIRPENFKLANVARALDLEVDDTKLHDGLYDINLTKNVYNALIKF